jgi:hypothetical protein
MGPDNLTIIAGAFGRLGVCRVAAALAAALSLPAAAVAGQLSVSTEVQGALFPREPPGRPAIEDEVRGSASIAYDRLLRMNIHFRGDLFVYGSNGQRPLVDGEAKVVWRGARAALAAGLLRERWGRFTDSPLDPLGPANTPFSLVNPELRLSQSTIRATAFFDRLSVDVYGLIGERRQPLPDSDGRFGFGVATSDVVRRGSLGDQALAVRVSGTEPSVDWAIHVFDGLSRRPTFVPRFTPGAQLAAIDAVYTDILQIGGEMETTRADWRFLAEGFGRRGGIDVTGREHTYVYVAAAAEYQRLGAADGAYNLIPRFEFMADTRGDRADIPFASAARAGMRIATTRILPVQVDMAYSYDWAFRGHGVLSAVEKALAESPTVNVGFRFTAFSAGHKRSILDIWKDDLELLGYVRLELSR